MMRSKDTLPYVATGVLSALLTAVLCMLVLPVTAGAQASQVTATAVTVVDENGKPLVMLRPSAIGVSGQVAVYGLDGTIRETLSTGGLAGRQPDASAGGLNVFYGGAAADTVGVRPAIRIGVDNNLPAFVLNDQAGKARFRASLDANGNPTIQTLDADGNVTWSAP